MCNPVNAYQESLKKFAETDPEDAAARAGARYNKDGRRLEIIYFGSLYMVESGGRVWRASAPGEEVPFNDRTLILQYLCQSSGLPPSGAWISFRELPGGYHHYAPLQTDAIFPLARVFGSCPEGFEDAARSLGGRPIPMGDRAFIIPALPKIPLAVVIREGDDEFEASSNMLYDSASQTHLTMAALWVLGVELAHKMIRHHDETAGREREISWLEGVRMD